MHRRFAAKVLLSGLGAMAYLLRKQNVPTAPLILGFVPGDLMEQNLRRALSITNGDASILVAQGQASARGFDLSLALRFLHLQPAKPCTAGFAGRPVRPGMSEKADERSCLNPDAA